MNASAPSRPLIPGIVTAIAGLVLAIGGIYLVFLGGTWYYLLAGLGVLASGIGLTLGKRWSLHLYTVVLAGTIIWALAEVGLHGWELEPRLLVPLLFGLVLLTPWVCRRLTGRASEPARTASDASDISATGRYASVATTGSFGSAPGCAGTACLAWHYGRHWVCRADRIIRAESSGRLWTDARR